MTTARADVPYIALPGVVLNVRVSRCPRCQEYEAAIPLVEGLERAITCAVLYKPVRLHGDEVRFLRAVLGCSSTDFATLLGSSLETVSRWEHNKQPLGHHADLLIRAMVALDHKIPLPLTALVVVDANAKATPPQYVFRFDRQWKEIRRGAKR